MSFQEILEFLNFLYAIGMLFEFAAFIKLRIKKPDLHRPYKVPLETFGAIALCLPPVILLVLVMCLASLRTYLVSAAVILFGFVLYPVLVRAKERRWVEFEADTTTLTDADNDIEGRPIVVTDDEATESLLTDLQSYSRTSHVSDDVSVEGGITKLE